MRKILRWLVWVVVQALHPLSTIFGEIGVLIVVFGAFFADATSEGVKWLVQTGNPSGKVPADMGPVCLGVGALCIAAAVFLHIFDTLTKDISRP